MSVERYFGKYQGTVRNNVDPMNRARLLVNVPDVLGPLGMAWAECCAPLAGPTGPPMGVYLVPPIGAGVWVEFEKGDPDYAIWSGCRFGAPSDVPLAATAGNPADPNLVLQSLLQQAVIISDLPPSVPPPVMPPVPPTGGIILRSTTGAYIVVNDAGVFISNGKGATINMIGTAIDFNTGALTILK